MAAEASRSSSSSADSYIGSLISLTSKSEIRYEGILIAINTEESSIALRNVRSFGTEGRKKDGPQVPPSDRVYEYILFRGSDIKDLQVKSSPLVQTPTPVPNDPAIIKSHYPPVAPIASTVPLPSASGSIQDPNTESSQIGLPRPTFQGNPPLYQPGATLGSWSPSQPPPSANNLTGTYWQGVYGSLNGFQAQQQSLFRPPPGVSVPPALQQAMQYPAVNSSQPSFGSNMLTSKLSESPSPLLPPLTSGIQNLSSSLLPAQSSATVADSSTSLIPNKPSILSLPSATLSTGLPLASPLTSVLDKSVSASSISDQSKTINNPIVTHLSTTETVTPLVSKSTYLSEGAIPSLVTPGQLLQSGPATSMSQHPPTTEKDVEVVQVSSSELPTAQISVETEAQEPILPLPVPSDQKVRATTAHAPHSYRGVRGRGHRISRPVTRFTEEFDFTAMNEKFNKDEVWGDLGKSNRVHENGDSLHDEEDFGPSNHEIKPVYVKDDFFDSLSCDALDSGSRGEKTKFSEQLRKDTETFGYMPRYRGGGRGGHGLGYGGRPRGSYYYGRGYGYGGRGRGHSYPSRDSYPNRAM